MSVEMSSKPELLLEYHHKVVPALQKSGRYSNVHQVPKLVKIVVNTCVGSAQDVKEALNVAKSEMALITGQAPIETLSKESIANFKLRKKQAIGAKVTLRGHRMYEFLERLIHAALPRIRDFRGLSPKAFDGHGNYTLGISDQSIFPEIDLDRIKRTIGFDVTIVTTALEDADAKLLLTELGFPFRDKPKLHETAVAEASAVEEEVV